MRDETKKKREEMWEVRDWDQNVLEMRFAGSRREEFID